MHACKEVNIMCAYFFLQRYLTFTALSLKIISLYCPFKNKTCHLGSEEWGHCFIFYIVLSPSIKMQGKVHWEFISVCIYSCCYTMKVFFCLMLVAIAGALQKRSEVRLLCLGKDTDPGFMQLLQYDGVLLPDAGCHSWGPAEAVWGKTVVPR
jgi:hypothetical protein